MIFTGNINKVENPFWKEIYYAWSELEEKRKNNSKLNNITNETIWENEKIMIDNHKIFYKSWTRAGVWLINDLLVQDGQFMSFQQFNELYNPNRTNFLQYQGVLSAIRKYLKNANKSEKDLHKTIGPILPNKIMIFLKSVKGSKDMYNLLKSSNEPPKSEEKWDNGLNKEHDWKSVNSSIFSTTKNTKLQWFQYRIEHRILGTNELLFKMNLRQNSNCSFCEEEPETTEHLFWTCRTITDLWEEINRWIFMETEIELPINLEFILFGFLEKNNKNQIRNLIII